jgi:deazaflavin-dependent oxidoreductase (nitroreductase family)
MPRGAMARFFSRLQASIYRRTSGGSGKDALLITTIGARSGESRVASVRRFDDGEGRWMVVGSAGGSARNPAWVHNLAANPDKVWIEIGPRKYKVRPEILAGDERATAWQRVVTEAPQFKSYETKTDREVPIIRLTAEG